MYIATKYSIHKYVSFHTLINLYIDFDLHLYTDFVNNNPIVILDKILYPIHL